MDSTDLRHLLGRSGSYADLAMAAASGQLDGRLPVQLFEHIGVVYDRLERLAHPDDVTNLAALRLAVLLHEESPDSLSRLLAAAGVSDFEPTVVTVISGFGELWKVKTDHDMARYVWAHTPHLACLLLFELAHEGQTTPNMERAAELGGLSARLERWTARLPEASGALR